MAEQSKSSLLDSLFGGAPDARDQADSRSSYQGGAANGSKDSSEKTSDPDFADYITGIFHKAKREALRDSD